MAITLQRIVFKCLSAMTFMLASIGNNVADQPTMAFVENLVIDLKFHDAINFNHHIATVLKGDQGLMKIAVIDKSCNVLFSANEITDFEKALSCFIGTAKSPDRMPKTHFQADLA